LGGITHLSLSRNPLERALGAGAFFWPPSFEVPLKEGFMKSGSGLAHGLGAKLTPLLPRTVENENAWTTPVLGSSNRTFSLVKTRSNRSQHAPQPAREIRTSSLHYQHKRTLNEATMNEPRRKLRSLAKSPLSIHYEFYQNNL